MNLLLHTYYPLYVQEGLGENVTPEKIKVTTQAYIKQQRSEIEHFLLEHVEFISSDKRNNHNTDYFKIKTVCEDLLNIQTIRQTYTEKEIDNYIQTKYTQYYVNEKKVNFTMKTYDNQNNQFTEHKKRKTERNIILHHKYHKNGYEIIEDIPLNDEP